MNRPTPEATEVTVNSPFRIDPHPLIGLACVILGAASMAAQEPPQRSTTPTLQVQTKLVQVPVIVQTSSKELVSGLSAADFQLMDDGVAQAVTLDSEADRPLSVVILIQTGASAPHEFGYYRHLATMLSSLLGDAPNRIAVVAFDSKHEGEMPFTSDLTEWAYAINHPDAGDGGAAILDNLSYALRLLNSEPSGNRRAIVLLSGPRDMGSKTSAKEIIRAAGETNTAIYALTFSPEKTAFKDAFTEPAHLNPPIDLGAGPTQAYFNLSAPLSMIIGAMRKNTTAELATLTGGEAAGFDTQHDLDDGLNTLANHLRNRYLLSFTPMSNRTGLHSLQVRLVNHPDVIVTARTNYWSAAPQ